MARLMMLSGQIDNSPVGKTIIHPRTEFAIGKFALKKVILWNENGTLGSAVTGFGRANEMGTYGVLELYDEHDITGTSTSAPTAANMILRVPVSGKSRLALNIPGNGLLFENGIRLKVGSEGDTNEDKYIYYQLVGYEH